MEIIIIVHRKCFRYLGSSNVGYDGTHGGFGYGSRNADGSRILEFADGLNLVICNTLCTKQEAKLVTYVAGPVKSTVDYIVGSWSARSPVCPLILAYKIPRSFPFAKTVCVSVRKNSVDVSKDKK